MEGLSDRKERASIRTAPSGGPPPPPAGTATPPLAPKARVRRLPLCEIRGARCPPHVNGAIIRAPRTNMVQTTLTLLANCLIRYGAGLGTDPAVPRHSASLAHKPNGSRRRALPLSRGGYDTQRCTD